MRECCNFPRQSWKQEEVKEVEKSPQEVLYGSLDHHWEVHEVDWGNGMKNNFNPLTLAVTQTVILIVTLTDYCKMI